MDVSEAKLPLQIIFIWHPKDQDKAKSLAENCFDLLSRDVQKPFSRSMNLPVYMYQDTARVMAKDNRTKHTLIFPFVSINTASDEKWVKHFKTEFKNLSKVNTVIPVALDSGGVCLSSIFGDVNFIRVYDEGEANQKDWLFITIAHEIYRRVFVPKKKKTVSRLSIFLSHRKEETGKAIADALKSFIDKRTHMRDFFDVTDIMPGDKFSKAIKKSIPNSVLLAIHTDRYSESYWCQKEVLLAKKHGVPMLRIDALEKGEDRSFPPLGNVPVQCIEKSPSDGDILRVLASMMLETVRMNYARAMFEVQSQWYGLAGADFTARVPEAADRLRKQDRQVIYYAGPTIYPHERKLLKAIDIQTCTLPDIWVPNVKKRIGISIADPEEEELKQLGLTKKHLEIIAQDLAHQLMLRKAVLLYGGDLRKDGFTEYLFEEARIMQDRLRSKKHFVENYLAWQSYCDDKEEEKCWKHKYRNVAKMHHVGRARDIRETDCSTKSLLERYVHSRCLTKMRKRLIKHSDIRICVGGKCRGYSGVMPGVLEEVLLAIKKDKPIFLLGGFGGATHYICEMIEDGVAQKLTYDWQNQNNFGYEELRKFYENKGRHEFEAYNLLAEKLVMKNLRNGLTDEENYRLFRTKYPVEAEYLILKGIKNLES